MTYPDPEVLNQPIEGRVEVERRTWITVAEVLVLAVIIGLAVFS